VGRRRVEPDRGAQVERARSFASLLDEVEGKMQVEVQPEPNAESLNANYEDTVAEQKRTLASRSLGGDQAAALWAGRRAPTGGAGPLEREGADLVQEQRHREPHRRVDVGARLRLDA
jgi:hypothetical protein